MTTVDDPDRPTPASRPRTPPTPPSAPPALSPVELSRWAWRQLTSMRTALVLLFLLALAAVPGSSCRRSAIDSVGSSQWQRRAPDAGAGLRQARAVLASTPRRGSPRSTCCCWSRWSAASCPRLRVYWRACAPGRRRRRATWPGCPAYADASRSTSRPERRPRRAPRAVLRRRALPGRPTDGRRRGRPRRRATCARPATCSSTSSVLVVLVGFAVGQLFGYKGGVIVVVGQGFSNTLSQYDDFAPGAALRPRRPRPVRASPSTTST